MRRPASRTVASVVAATAVTAIPAVTKVCEPSSETAWPPPEPTLGKPPVAN